MADAFKALGQNQTTKRISVEHASYLKSHLQLSTREWTDLRLALQEITRLPTKDEIRYYTNSFMPTKNIQEHGIFVDLYEAVSIILTRLPDDVKATLVAELDDGDKILARFAAGIDTSGNHRTYNSPTSVAEDVKTTHMFFCGFAFLLMQSYDGRSKPLWVNKLASSVNGEYPLAIFPGMSFEKCNFKVF